MYICQYLGLYVVYLDWVICIGGRVICTCLLMYIGIGLSSPFAGIDRSLRIIGNTFFHPFPFNDHESLLGRGIIEGFAKMPPRATYSARGLSIQELE